MLGLYGGYIQIEKNTLLQLELLTFLENVGSYRYLNKSF